MENTWYEMTPHKQTRENVLISIPAEKKTLRVRHARHTARVAPEPRRVSPDGLPLSPYLALVRTVSVRRDRSEKVPKN